MKVLIALLSFIAVVLLAAAVMPKTMDVSAETSIAAPADQVRNYVKLLKNQEEYSVWVMADPNVQLDYQGTDGTVGFVSSWSSEQKNVGVGAQEITKMTEGESYEVEIRFEKPMKAVNYAETRVEAISDTETKVTTRFRGPSPWPFNLMLPFITPKLEKDIQQTLENLKGVLEE